MTESTRILEIYKCVVLTVIAVALVALYLKTPVPFTLENVRSKKVELTEVPLVRIQGGHVNTE